MLGLLFLRFGLLQQAKHAPQTDERDNREHQQPDDKLRDTADINVTLLVRHINVLDVRRVRRLGDVHLVIAFCHFVSL